MSSIKADKNNINLHKPILIKLYPILSRETSRMVCIDIEG